MPQILNPLHIGDWTGDDLAPPSDGYSYLFFDPGENAIVVKKNSETFRLYASTGTGGNVINVSAVTGSSYTVQTTDYVVGVSSNSNSTITLPLASSVPRGKSYIIKDEGGASVTYPITIEPTSPDTINGNTSTILRRAFASVNLYSNGTTTWFLF